MFCVSLIFCYQAPTCPIRRLILHHRDLIATLPMCLYSAHIYSWCSFGLLLLQKFGLVAEFFRKWPTPTAVIYGSFDEMVDHVQILGWGMWVLAVFELQWLKIGLIFYNTHRINVCLSSVLPFGQFPPKLLFGQFPPKFPFIHSLSTKAWMFSFLLPPPPPQLIF